MTLNGTPVNFGYSGANNGITITNLSGKMLLQSADHSKTADVESARGGQGDILTRGWYDIHDEATLEWIISDATNVAGALTNTTLTGVNPGDFIVVTACANDPGLAGTWEVQSGSKIVGSNTTFKKLSCSLHKRAGVTAVAA